MHLLVLGGNSDIGYAMARQYADRYQADITLASRDMESLEKKASDLSIRYDVRCSAEYFDATDYSSHRTFFDSIDPMPDGIILAFGYMPDQAEAQQQFSEAGKTIESNYLGAVSILEIAASHFENRQQGFIIGISSVAGERGRQQNYIYGSTKSAVSAYLSGLRQRLQNSGVQVLTVKPGLVRTKMTEGREMPGILTMSPQLVAEKSIQALNRGRSITYVTWYWRGIMMVVKMIPEFIFKRLNL